MLKLFISSRDSEAVKIIVQSLEGFNFVKHDQTLEIDVPYDFAVKYSTQRYKGIKITSVNDSVFGQSYRNKSSGVFAALPCVKQDVKEYGLTFKDNIDEEKSWLLAVSCENDKINSELIILNEMETYLFSEHSDLTGIRVVSNKPILFWS